MGGSNILDNGKKADMDALVLCGGYATRLSPISNFIPKALLPINGVPLINYILEDIYDKVDRIVLSINEKFVDQFEYWKENKNVGKFLNKLSFILEPTHNNGEKFGVVKGTSYAIDQSNFKNDLLVLTGDVFREFSLKEFIGKFKEVKISSILLRDLDEFKIKSTDSISFQEFVEINKNLERDRKRTLSCGAVVFTNQAFNKIREYPYFTDKGDSFTAFTKWLAKVDNIILVTSKGASFDIGTLSSYEELFSNYLTKGLEIRKLKRIDMSELVSKNNKIKSGFQSG